MARALRRVRRERSALALPMLNSLASLTALATETAPLAGPRGAGADLTWLMGVIAVLLIAIGALAFGFRKIAVGAIRNRASRRDLKVIDMLPLGNKRQLAVVRCYDRTFALGLGEKSVELVAELDTGVVTTEIAASVDERREVFRARLESAKERLLGVHDLMPRGRQAVATADRPTASPAVEATPQDGAQEYVA